VRAWCTSDGRSGGGWLVLRAGLRGPTRRGAAADTRTHWPQLHRKIQCDARIPCLLPREQGGYGSMGEGPDGRYLIVRHLATGGYGSVFEVRAPDCRA